MAAASNDYLTQMGNIKTAMSGLKTQFFGASVIPMTGAFVTLSEAIAANGPLAQDLGKKLGEFVTKAIQKLPEIIAYLKEFGEKVWENITRVKDFVGGWKNLAVGIGVLVSLKTALSGVQAALSGAKLAKEAFTLALKTGQAVVGGVKTAYGLLTGSMSVMKAASEGNKLALLMLNAQMVKAKVIAIANKTAMIAMAAAQKVAAAAQWLLNAAMSANPIGLIIAGITALIAIIVLLVKNWDTVKEAALKTWDAILGAVIKAGESIKNVFLGVIEWVKSNWQSIVAFIINPFAGAFKYLYDNFEGFRNIVNNVVGAIVGFFLAGFDAIKQKLTAFVEFFTSKFASIKDFFGGVGSKVGGAFEKIKSILPGHAEGGIFTHRHIAEIAERGAEAIIPLNKSPGGFDIWKRAGEMGGYLQQAQTATTRAGMSQPRTSPVMRAASQKMSGGDSPFTMTATFNITVNGGGSDKETVENIRKGVGQAADDFKEKWIRTFEEFNRDNRRVSFA
ncbi:MAG: hypothetical protein FWG29_05635 [Treponema sp.]|nr:hypothetical protein [Treponema sp.]